MLSYKPIYDDLGNVLRAQIINFDICFDSTITVDEYLDFMQDILALYDLKINDNIFAINTINILLIKQNITY